MDLITLFGRKHETDFIMFSLPHFIALGVTAILCLLLFSARFALRTRPSLRNSVRWLLIIVLLASDGGLHAWYLSHGIWTARHSLPLELCGITLLLSIIMLLTRSRLLYDFLYFAGIGERLSLFNPQSGISFSSFPFYTVFHRPCGDSAVIPVHDLGLRLPSNLAVTAVHDAGSQPGCCRGLWPG